MPNNSFKPNLLRYGKSVAEKACHAFASTTQVGLTQALGASMSISEIWKYLHDGSIDRVDGVVPGDIDVHISIPYLRKAFSPSGDGFVLSLMGCSRFELQDDLGPTCIDVQEIARRSPEILSLVSEDPLAIYSTLGTLQLAYASISIKLDTGETISAQDLDLASASYWDSWSKRHGGSA